MPTAPGQDPSTAPPPFDAETDLLVFGAGAGGMTAALAADLAGLQVILCEKTTMVGGTTATSGGTTWVPGTALSQAAGQPDSAVAAGEFLDHVVGARGGRDLRAAFLASGAEAIAALSGASALRFVAAAAHPDYLDGPGSAYGGRALAPVEFDGRVLGRDFARIRPPRAVFMGLGGMMVGRAELGALLQPFASLANFKTTLKVVLPYLRDRLRHRRGTRLIMGNALVARLFYSLRQRQVPVWFESPLVGLIGDGAGAVIGARIATPQGPRAIRARLGVVLATGGIGASPALRARLFPPQIGALSQAAPGNSGDGIALAEAEAGARLDSGGDSPALWMPCSLLNQRDGSQAIWPHILLDRAKPGLIAVGADGRRFVNESDSYHDFCMGMLRAGLREAWLIADAAFVKRYGLGLVLPGGRGLGQRLRQGYVQRAATLADLARAIGVDAQGLADSVAANNRFAAEGVDHDFGRGTSVMNRFNGDATVAGNPCLGPLAQAPFYALRVVPVDLAGAGGLAIDADGGVLGQGGGAIAGLYACGNDAASLFRGTYPGPGTTIGPAMVMGWRIAQAARARRQAGAGLGPGAGLGAGG